MSLIQVAKRLFGVALLASGLILAGCETCKPAAEKSPKPQPVAAAPVAAPVEAPIAKAGMTSTMVAFPTGDKSTSVVLIERIAPSEVNLNTPFCYDIKATNLTKLPLNDVVVADECAENFKLEKSTPAAKVVDGRILRWELGTLAAGESKTITVCGSATKEAALQNCVTVAYDQRACLVINVVQPALQLAMTAPAQVLKCDPIPVQYTVTNTGTGVARNVVLDHPLAKGLTSSTGASTYSVKIGDLGPGQSKTVSDVFAASANGKFDHAAVASADNQLKADASGATTVLQPELTLEGTCSKQIFVGRNASYDLTLTNKGDGEARNATLVYNIPAGAKVVSATAGAAATPSSLTWNLGTLAPAAVVKANIVVEPPGIGKITHNAAFNAFCATAVTAQCVTETIGIPAILMEVVDATDPIEVGSNVTYIITITNQGSATDTNIVIACELEDSMEFVSTGGATAGKSDGKKVTFAALPSLAPKAQASWQVVVKAVKAGDVRFKTTMNTDTLTRPVEETEATNFYK